MFKNRMKDDATASIERFAAKSRTGLAAIIALAVVGGAPAAHAAPEPQTGESAAVADPASPNYSASGPRTVPAAAVSAASGTTSARNIIHVSIDSPPSVIFDGQYLQLPRPPMIVSGTMMVPARALLQRFGYQTVWNNEESELTAVHPALPDLVFWKNSRKAKIGGQLVNNLPAAPFSSEGALWIPLRPVVEAAGYAMEWDPSNRVAIVADPLAIPSFTVAASASNGAVGEPAGLERYIRSEWGADSKITLIEPDNYIQKTNVMIAAGDPASLMLLTNPYSYPDELLRSIALDLTDAVGAHPPLAALTEGDSPGTRRIDGELYGIPRLYDPHDAPFPALRQDWLNKLGLARPQTMEELSAVLEAFVTLDPDGNGRNDSIGLTGYADAGGLGSLSWVEQVYTGSPDRFGVKDGKAVDHAVGAEEKQALEWLTDAYKKGWIDREFPIQSEKQADDKLSQGLVGVAAIPLDRAASLTAAGHPASWTPLAGIRAAADSEPAAPWNSKGNGMYIVSSMKLANPDIPLKWLERGIAMTRDGRWDGVEELTDEDRAAAESLFGRPDMLAGNRGLERLDDKQRDVYEAAVRSWRQISYDGRTLPEAEQLWSSGKYAELNIGLAQMKLKIILGKEPLSAWDRYVAEMTASADYRSMMAELDALAGETQGTKPSEMILLP